jgi:hypothetical protein
MAGQVKKRSPASGGMSSTFRRGLQRSYWALDGILKQLLTIFDVFVNILRKFLLNYQFN